MEIIGFILTLFIGLLIGLLGGGGSILTVPSVLSLYWIRAYALPAIPKYFVLFGISIEKNMAMMVFFQC
ncbi:MAG TPA: hypothetical protein VL022_08230 [Moheibacter sp.]|nr:hypothetical protein [Moheibacter sp.]